MQEVPSELQLTLLKEKLNSADCTARGWILEGYPNSALEGRGMLAGGLLPTRFLRLELEDEEALRRLTGRRVDPVANTVYHLDDSPPPAGEVAERVVQRADDAEARVIERCV